MFPHVIAAIQMIHKGKKMKTGENIDFLYVNAAHRNPFRRVIPASVLNNGHHYYDREKYLEMVLDVAETVLGVFGFNRKHLGFKPHSKDFLKEIYWEREQETLYVLQNSSLIKQITESIKTYNSGTGYRPSQKEIDEINSI